MSEGFSSSEPQQQQQLLVFCWVFFASCLQIAAGLALCFQPPPKTAGEVRITGSEPTPGEARCVVTNSGRSISALCDITRGCIFFHCALCIEELKKNNSGCLDIFFCFNFLLFCFVFVILRTLPESPPDSSSEPYSPQQVNGEWFATFFFSFFFFKKGD